MQVYIGDKCQGTMTVSFELNGDLFQSGCDAIVNTVNCVGVMGKGLALEFKRRYPYESDRYVGSCEIGRVKPGVPFITSVKSWQGSYIGPAWIIHAPTKDHWRHPSRMEWVVSICAGLRQFCIDRAVGSIAVPKMGCENGMLEWTQVCPIVKSAFSDLDTTHAVIYGSDVSSIV